MTFALVLTDAFERRIRRFTKTHPELKSRIAQTLRDLEEDPFQPHLRLHMLHGELSGMYAVRLTHAYRITLRPRFAEREIVLLDIGSHDDVYRP